MTEYPGLADLLMKNCTTQRCSMMVRHLVLVKRDRARVGIAHEGGWCQSLCQAIQALDAWSVAGFANGVANLSHHSIRIYTNQEITNTLYKSILDLEITQIYAGSTLNAQKVTLPDSKLFPATPLQPFPELCSTVGRAQGLALQAKVALLPANLNMSPWNEISWLPGCHIRMCSLGKRDSNGFEGFLDSKQDFPEVLGISRH